MKRLFVLVFGVLMSVLLITAVNAGPNNAPTSQKEEAQVQTPEQAGQSYQVTPKNAGPTLREKVMQRRAIQESAIQRRNAEMRKGAQCNNSNNTGKEAQQTVK